MKNLILFILTLFILRCNPDVPAVQAQNAPADGDVYAIENVNVVPMDSERVLEGQTVIVRGDRIEAVGEASSVEVPEDAVRIDGAGKYVMPGLAEMHGHIPPPSASTEYIESVLFMYAANGITTVRGMLGHEGQLELRNRANSGEIISPTLYLAGPSFNGNSVNSPAEAEAMVRRQHAEGWDLLKVHPGLTLEEFDAMAKTANEVGIRFGGHVPADVGLAHAIEMGQETFDHIDGYIIHMSGESELVSEETLSEAVELTRNAGAWVVPTMVLWEALYGITDIEHARNLPELKYMPRQTVDAWISGHEQRLNNPALDKTASANRIENRMRLLKALNDANALILMGTDAPQIFSVPGFSIHEELKRMAETGMTPYEIFKTGTYNVGEYFKDQDDFGTIAAGKRADLLLIDANPLEDVANIQHRTGVMVRGTWIPESEIQEELTKIAAMHSSGS